MGQLILKELGLSDTNKTLTRWISHRISELLEREEQEPDPNRRELARQECADLVMRLWQQRQHWPDRAPLSRIVPVLERACRERKPYRDPSGEQISTWLEAVPLLTELHAEAMQACWDAAILQISRGDIDEELERVAPCIEDLGDEERKTVELLKWMLAAVDEHPDIASLTPEQQTEHFRGTLTAIQEKQARLFASVNSSVVPLGRALGDEGDDEGEDDAADADAADADGVD